MPTFSSVDPAPGTLRCVTGWIRWRWAWLIVGLALAALSWAPAGRLKFDRSIDNMFAANDPLLPPFHLLKRTFGGDEVVLAAYVDPQLMSPEGLARTGSLAEQLEQVPGVAGVVSLAGVPLLGSGALRNEAGWRAVEGFLVGADRQTTAAVCLLMPENLAPLPRAETIAQLRAAVAAHDPSGVVAGEPVMVVDGFRYLDEDGRRLNRTCTWLLIATIVLCFRSLRWVVVPVAVVQVARLWTEAVLVLSDFRLSMVSSMLSAIITVVGVATVIHLVVRFRQARQEGLMPEAALARAGSLALAAIVWSCLTDAAGFGSLGLARVGPVQDFGLMMATGSVVVLAAVAIWVPGLALIGRWDADPHRVWGEELLEVALRQLLVRLLAHPWRWAVATSLIGIAAAAGCWQLEVETDFTRNFRNDSAIVQSYQFVEARLGGAAVWDVVLPAPEVLDVEYLQRVKRLEDRLRSEIVFPDAQGRPAPGLTKVLSLVDLLEANPLVKLDRLPTGRLGQSMLLGVVELLNRQLPVVTQALRGHDPQAPAQHYLRIMLRAQERQPAGQKKALIAAVERIAREEFPQAQVTGYFVLLTHLIDSLLADQWRTFGVATAIIGLMMICVLRSWRLALVALVPNVVPILMVTGLLGWLGLKVNMGAAMIAAVSIGLSVDSAIHYLLDFQRLRRVGWSTAAALDQVQQSVGRAAVISTVALVVGFLALCQSQFVPTIYFGALVSLAMLGGLAGNLVALPLLVRLVLGTGPGTVAPSSTRAAPPQSG